MNRAFGSDYPGTYVLRRDTFLRMGGYDGDAMFENLEMARTIRAVGGQELRVDDLFVARRPPSAGHFLRQRVRQAYDSLAQPARLLVEVALLPGLVALGGAARRRCGWQGLAGALSAVAAVAVLRPRWADDETVVQSRSPPPRRCGHRCGCSSERSVSGSRWGAVCAVAFGTAIGEFCSQRTGCRRCVDRRPWSLLSSAPTARSARVRTTSLTNRYPSEPAGMREARPSLGEPGCRFHRSSRWVATAASVSTAQAAPNRMSVTTVES